MCYMAKSKNFNRKEKNDKASHSKWKKVGKAGLTAGKWLLEFLGLMLEIMPGLETPRSYGRRLDGWPKEIPRNRIYEEVKRMKNRGWIEEAEKQGQKFIKLTEKGYLELLYQKLHSLSRVKGQKWAGDWWMALYDIPEDARKERHAMRDALHLAGFYYLQKSVYIYPDKIPDDLVVYLKQAGLLPYVRFVHVDHIDGVGEIEKHFNLCRRFRFGRK